MTAREKLQAAYELAFFPPRFHQVWREFKTGVIEDKKGLRELVDMALTLHQALPETGYASQRALKRLAIYQANARAFGMVTCLRNFRKKLGATEEFSVHVVPGAMVRDIGLPELSHHPARKGTRQCRRRQGRSSGKRGRLLYRARPQS